MGDSKAQPPHGCRFLCTAPEWRLLTRPAHISYIGQPGGYFPRSLILLPNYHSCSTHLALGWVLFTEALITATHLPPAPWPAVISDNITVHMKDPSDHGHTGPDPSHSDIHLPCISSHPSHTVAFSSRTAPLPPLTLQHYTPSCFHAMAPPCSPVDIFTPWSL